MSGSTSPPNSQKHLSDVALTEKSKIKQRSNEPPNSSEQLFELDNEVVTKEQNEESINKLSSSAPPVDKEVQTDTIHNDSQRILEQFPEFSATYITEVLSWIRMQHAMMSAYQPIFFPNFLNPNALQSTSSSVSTSAPRISTEPGVVNGFHFPLGEASRHAQSTSAVNIPNVGVAIPVSHPFMGVYHPLVHPNQEKANQTVPPPKPVKKIDFSQQTESIATPNGLLQNREVKIENGSGEDSAGVERGNKTISLLPRIYDPIPISRSTRSFPKSITVQKNNYQMMNNIRTQPEVRKVRLAPPPGLSTHPTQYAKFTTSFVRPSPPPYFGSMRRIGGSSNGNGTLSVRSFNTPPAPKYVPLTYNRVPFVPKVPKDSPDKIVSQGTNAVPPPSTTTNPVKVAPAIQDQSKPRGIRVASVFTSRKEEAPVVETERKRSVSPTILLKKDEESDSPRRKRSANKLEIDMLDQKPSERRRKKCNPRERFSPSRY